MSRDNAIVKAIDLCISTNILSEYLTEHYQGVSKMLNWEYDADAERRVLRNEALEEGMQKGKIDGAELLAKLIKDGVSVDEALESIKST